MGKKVDGRCYKQYLDEICDEPDDFKHVYHSLRNVVSRCRKSAQFDRTVQNMGDCHYQIRDLADTCLTSALYDTEEHDDNMEHTMIGEMLKNGAYNQDYRRKKVTGPSSSSGPNFDRW